MNAFDIFDHEAGSTMGIRAKRIGQAASLSEAIAIAEAKKSLKGAGVVDMTGRLVYTVAPAFFVRQP